MQVSQNVVRTLHSDPTFKPDKDSVVVQLMGQIRNMEDTISSVLLALEYGPDMATIYRLNKIKGTDATTEESQANLEGVDNPEESQANLEGVDNPEESQATLNDIDDPEESTVNLEGLDDPKESLANLEGENSDLKSEIIAMKKKFAEMETDMKSKIQHIEKANKYMIKGIGALDGRLSLAEKRTAVCGFKGELDFDSDTTLTFDQVNDEVNSGGVLEESGYFTAQITGVYLVNLNAVISLEGGSAMYGVLKLSSGQYDSNGEDWFIYSCNDAGPYIRDQASASRYVKMAAGETLHIDLSPHNGEVGVYQSMLCVSLYSASG